VAYDCITARDFIHKNGGDPMDEIARITYIRSQLQSIIDQYQPTVVGLEETVLTQFRGKATNTNVAVFRSLSKCLGVVECELFDKEIPYIIFGSSEWRKGKIKGRDRIEKKKNAIEYVNEKYGLELKWVSDSSKFNEDDKAEAIMIAEATRERYKKLKK